MEVVDHMADERNGLAELSGVGGVWGEGVGENEDRDGRSDEGGEVWEVAWVRGEVVAAAFVEALAVDSKRGTVEGRTDHENRGSLSRRWVYLANRLLSHPKLSRFGA